jgi:hypothetical protein
MRAVQNKQLAIQKIQSKIDALNTRKANAFAVIDDEHKRLARRLQESKAMPRRKLWQSLILKLRSLRSSAKPRAG